MGLTNFPHGITSFGVPQIADGALIPVTSGSYFWVDSSASGGGNGSYEMPVTTLSAAYALCTASKADVIIIKPGHAETISAATGVVLNKIGVSIIGLGTGALRPTFTLSGTAATCTFTVSGASQLLRNFIISCGVDELVAAITVSAANVTIDTVDYVEDDVTHQVLVFLLTTAAANFLTVINCTLIQVTAPAGNGAAITLVGADDCKIVNNRIHWLTTNNAGSGGIQGLTTESLRMFIADNFVDCQGGATVLGIAPLASSTGIMVRNGASTPNGAGSIVGRAGMLVMENYAGTSGTTSAILDPTAGV